MKVFSKLLAAGIFIAAFAGCASVNSVSLTPIPSQRSHPVNAEVSKTIFLAFNFDNDYIDPLVQELKAKCPNGIVSGILTKDETVSYVIVFKKRITATGFCSVARTADTEKARRRRPSSSEPALQPAPQSDAEEIL